MEDPGPETRNMGIGSREKPPSTPPVLPSIHTLRADPINTVPTRSIIHGRIIAGREQQKQQRGAGGPGVVPLSFIPPPIPSHQGAPPGFRVGMRSVTRGGPHRSPLICVSGEKKMSCGRGGKDGCVGSVVHCSRLSCLEKAPTHRPPVSDGCFFPPTQPA